MYKLGGVFFFKAEITDLKNQLSHKTKPPKTVQEKGGKTQPVNQS